MARLLEEYMKGRVRVPAGQESLFAHDIGMRAVTVTDVVRTIRAVAKKAGQLNVEDEFSTKSMRIGGVTTLIDKAEVAGHVIQKHGRWSTETWNKVYSRMTKKTEVMLAEHMS